MAHPPFHTTRMGQKFYEVTMMNIAKELKEANILKRKELELKEREIQLSESKS